MHTGFLRALFLATLVPAQAADLGNLVVVGDSLSAGFQNGVLRACQQVKGYANLVATQADAPLILPLIADPGFGPGLNGTGVIPNAFPPRVNFWEQATNLAVPGQTVGQALTMVPQSTAFPIPFYQPTVPEDGAQMMTNVVLGYPAYFLLQQPSPQFALSQVQWANALQPDTIILWVGNNDVLGLFEGVQSAITDPLTFTKNLDQVLSSLATKNRRMIIANIPDVTVLPYMRANFLSNNPALTQQLKILVASYNAIIRVLAIRYHAALVDIFSLVNQLATNGITVNNVPLTIQARGGLFSLDGIHPTDVGYAIIANAFIGTINSRFGTKILPVNLTTVALGDPLFPGNKVTVCRPD